MSERKVLNKYFPPDFDPAKIPRRKMAADQQHKVRLMAPFSMRCNTCGDYVYKGKKFNARKEKVEGETYLGIMIFRFYIRCPKCSAEITFKTDPKNTDYVCEHGAMRNFEPWREETDVNELKKAEKEKEEENNPMKALENRTVASKVEMDILDALDEIRTRNAATERMDVAAVLDRLQGKQRKEVERLLKAQDDADEALARAVFKSSDDGVAIRRLVESD
ncbi:CWC16 protein, partial [Obelidium mucronatum]